jgi:hypothetical protein
VTKSDVRSRFDVFSFRFRGAGWEIYICIIQYSSTVRLPSGSLIRRWRNEWMRGIWFCLKNVGKTSKSNELSNELVILDETGHKCGIRYTHVHCIYPIYGQTQIMLKSIPPTLPLKGGEYGKLRPYILPHHICIFTYIYIYCHLQIIVMSSTLTALP